LDTLSASSLDAPIEYTASAKSSDMALVANLTLVVGFCRRQAGQAGAAAEKTPIDLRDGLFAALWTLWEQYFGCIPLVWM
jgi:hypothetical protein